MRRVDTAHIEEIADLSLDAVWLEDTGTEMEDKLALWWQKLRPGGYLGGPSCGFGFTPCGRWTLNTEAMVKRFVHTNADSSEIFTGHQVNPCWFVFKKEPEEPRVLLISGSNQEQHQTFGILSRQNHQTYADLHGYEYCWIDWEKFWKEPRHWVWAKILAVIRKLEMGNWTQIWWIDADAVFLNFRKRLDGFLHPSWIGVYPEFVKDRVMASTGVWGSTGSQLPGLRDVWSRSNRGFGVFSEELCLADSIHQRADLWKKIQLVDHRLFNSVPGKRISYQKFDDNFIVHLSGINNEQRRAIIQEINESLYL